MTDLRYVGVQARGWARRLGAKLAALGITPNTNSLASVVSSVWAAGASIAIPFSPGDGARVALLVAAGLCSGPSSSPPASAAAW